MGNDHSAELAVDHANERLAELQRQRALDDARYKTEQAREEARRQEREEQLEAEQSRIRNEAQQREAENEKRHQNQIQMLKLSEENRREAERQHRREVEEIRAAEREEQRRLQQQMMRNQAESAASHQQLMEKMEIRDREHATEVTEIQAKFQDMFIQAGRDNNQELQRALGEHDQRAGEMLEEIRKQHKEDIESTIVHHKSVMSIMDKQLQMQQKMNEDLMNRLTDLMKQFSQSRNDFFDYVKNKPENDIVVPENLEETIQKAKRDLKLDTRNCYNFAFIGHTCSGKSSLINAIRGLKDDHPKAAKVGITETTHEIQPYTFEDPQYSHVKIYDIPGAGTLTHNAESYYHDKCLCAFDCLIILTQDTLAQDEINFAIQSLRYNQSIAFVRSKCDIVLYNALIKGEISQIDQQAVKHYISEMSDFYVEEIQRVDKPELCRVPCFFLSAYSLRNLIRGEKPAAVYHEKNFIDYMQAKSKWSRNIQQH